MSSFEINPYDRSRHGEARKAFDCGTPDLNHYFQVQMSQDLKSRFTSCFVATNEDGVIIGYYTLCSSAFSLADLSEDQKKSLKVRGYQNAPAALVGRLAVDARFKGQGFGGVLLADAMEKVLASGVGTFAVIVDAKDANAKLFYEHHGFIPFPTNPMSLFFPLSGFKA